MEINTDLHTSSASNAFTSGCNAKSVLAFKEEGVKLFGVRLTENSMMMRKAVSMGNLSSYNSASSLPPQPSTPEHSESGDQHGYVSDGLVQNSGSLRERKKGVPWTEDEHRMFLVGLQKLGKGDWRGISRNFVPSRTPTQVASHAQKYFLRQSNLNKRKRRSSLFDIISSNTVPTSNTISPAAMELDLTSSKLSFNLAAPIAALETPNIALESAPLNINALGSDLTSISADLCLGRAHKSQQKPQLRWPHTFSSPQQVDVANTPASPSTSDCMQLLPPLSFMSYRSIQEREMVRPSGATATTSSTLTTLCRIDETADVSANLRLSIGPSLLLEPMELSLKLEQPVSRHSTAMVGTSNSGNTLTNAIRVV